MKMKRSLQCCSPSHTAAIVSVCIKLDEEASWIQERTLKQLKKETFGDPQNVSKSLEKVVKCSGYEC